MVWLVWWECACLAVEREYVWITQCCVSFMTAVVVAERWEKMVAMILSPANSKICAVIRFLHAEKQSPAEIHRQLCHVHGYYIMSDGMVRRWCGQFAEGRSKVHDVDHSGRPSLVTRELMESVRQAVFQYRRFTYFRTLWSIPPDVSLISEWNRLPVARKHFRLINKTITINSTNILFLPHLISLPDLTEPRPVGGGN